MLAAHLSQISEIIAQNFSAEWWQKYSFQNENDLNENANIQAFQNDVEKLVVDIFDLLNKSILIGEYVDENFSDRIRGVENSLHSIVPLTFTSENIQEAIIESLVHNFVNPADIALRQYSAFYIQLGSKYKIDSRRFVYSHDTHIGKIVSQNRLNTNSRTNLSFFTTNLNVAAWDHFLTPGANFLDRLFTVLNNHELDSNKYSVVLKDKCSYLINKLLLREQFINEKPIYIIKDNIEQLFVAKTYYQCDLYEHWGDFIESHYGLSFHANFDIQKDFDHIKSRKLKELSFKELHRLIKYYKDVVQSLSNLTQVRKEIEERYEKVNINERPIDSYSKAICLVYVYNNEFSLMIELKRPDSELEIFYQKIIDIEKATGIKNFFPQFKYLKCLTQRLEAIYNKRQALDIVSKAREIINKCELIIETYKEHISWAETNYNYVYQLPYSECITPIKKQSIDSIFIASSFLLPLSKEKYKKEFEENKARVAALKTSIEVFENVENDFKEFDEMKAEVSAKQTQTLEIIGVFTALVTFVFSSVEAFQFLKGTKAVLLFMLALSTSLCFFLILILGLFKGKGYLKEHWIGIAAFMVSTVLFWGLLLTCG